MAPSGSRVEFDSVGKRFYRGRRSDSLRELFSVATMLNGARRTRESFWALRGVSFSVEPGNALGIIGPNGSGKSTALRLLAGILRPDEGQVHVSAGKSRRPRLGAVIELAAGFHYELTGRENIYLQGAVLGMRRDEIGRKFDEIVDFAELSSFIDSPVKHYSSGMVARLGFSIAAHLDPDVLVIDEVLAVGDDAFQKKAFARMAAMVRSDVPAIVVSHQLHRIMELCNRAILLTRGQVLKEGTPSECVEAYGAATESLDERDAAAVTLSRTSSPEPATVDPGERIRVRIQGTVNTENAGTAVSIGLRIRSFPSEEPVFVVVGDERRTRYLPGAVSCVGQGEQQGSHKRSVSFHRSGRNHNYWMGPRFQRSPFSNDLMMTTMAEGVANLRGRVEQTLRPLLASRSVDAVVAFQNGPNPGDNAIYLGQLACLKSLSIAPPRVVPDYRTYDRRALGRAIGDGIILLTGGGSFGDLWPIGQAYREDVLRAFPDTPVIQLPQSMYFERRDALDRARAAVESHRNVILLWRDERSLELARREFNVPNELCPDMAFCLGTIDRSRAPARPIVWISRKDRERVWDAPEDAPGLTDWPDDRATPLRRINYCLMGATVRFPSTDVWRRLLMRSYVPLARQRLGRGLDMLSEGKLVITDRLHGHILAMLMQIPTILIDNSYGKLSSFYDTWMRDVAGVRFASSPLEALAMAQEEPVEMALDNRR
ncbi:MAG: polysaccharide pyruvyl transferase family protein [Gemmatimonadales bacterium]